VHVLGGYDNDAFSVPTVVPDPLAIYLPHMYLFDIKVFLHEFFHFQSLDLGLGSIENDHVEGPELWNEPLESNCWKRNLMSKAFETLHGYLITQKQSDFFNGNQIEIDHTTQKHIYPTGIVPNLFGKDCSKFERSIEYVNYNHSHICDDDYIASTQKSVNQEMDTILFFTPTEKKSLIQALENEAKIITAGTKFSYVDYAKLKYRRVMQKYHNINLFKVGELKGRTDKANNIVSQPGKLNTLFNDYVSTINDPQYSFNEKIFLLGYERGLK
jgi:hypothetical protein